MNSSQQIRELSHIIISVLSMKKCQLREVLKLGQSCTAEEGTEPGNQNEFFSL